MYLASVGGTGLRELAALNRDKAEYLKTALTKAGVRIVFDAPTFNEFVVELPGNHATTYRNLWENHIVAGFPLATHYPELDGSYLLCVTETKTKTDLDELVRELTS